MNFVRVRIVNGFLSVQYVLCFLTMTPLLYVSKPSPLSAECWRLPLD